MSLLIVAVVLVVTVYILSMKVLRFVKKVVNMPAKKVTRPETVSTPVLYESGMTTDFSEALAVHYMRHKIVEWELFGGGTKDEVMERAYEFLKQKGIAVLARRV